MLGRALLLAGIAVHLVAAAAAGQAWNDRVTLALVERAVARRGLALADTSLHDYRARAHGFVFFLGQFGEGFEEPPRLVKADQLALEVYWKAPGLSKQRIVGWRDREELPTGIQYHRDHLGIVQNNFADRIGLGHDDEVRNVPHPLAADGPAVYEYALVDSLRIRLPGREVRVYEVLARPRTPSRPAVVGSLYLDAATAELVRFRFEFTRAAYVDASLEDIAIVLENGLWNERYWLPRRQEIEIRRRATWLELPARGIIRGRWEITDYDFNVGLPDSLFRGFEIVAVAAAERAQYRWGVPLDAALREAAAPVPELELGEVRERVRDIVAARMLGGLPPARPGARSLSELLHFNRVEGLAPGFGAVLRPDPATELRLSGSYGVGDRRLKARLHARRRLHGWSIELRATRAVEDVGDEPVVAPLLNSLTAQEGGDDYGDYVLAQRVTGAVRRDFGPDREIALTLGVEHTASMELRAPPARGAFRPNPALGSGTFGVARLALEARHRAAAGGAWAEGSTGLEVGARSGAAYARVHAAGRLGLPLGPTELVGTVSGGWGSVDLPPHRSFVLGGRGTLMSEPFRAWGGRYAALGGFEWRVPVLVPAVPLGAFASTGRRVVVAPFVRLGGGGGSMAAVPWRPSEGVRAVAGVAVEWFYRLIRVEAGAGLRGGNAGLVVDLRRDLWAIL